MKYLFDTDTLIDFLEDRDETRPHVNALISAGDEVALCAITVGELYSGLNPQKRAKWEKWLMALPYWQISRQAAKQAGIYRKTASDAGRTFSISDSLKRPTRNLLMFHSFNLCPLTNVWHIC